MPRFHIVHTLLLIAAVLHCIVLVKLGVGGLFSLLSTDSAQPLLKRATEVSVDLRKVEREADRAAKRQRWTGEPISPIHILLTSTASYNTGLLALVNSTLVSASPSSLPRLHFHLISSNQGEAEEVAELLHERFGARIAGKLTAYGLAEVGDERLDGVKVWGGYRSEQLSKVSRLAAGGE